MVPGLWGDGSYVSFESVAHPGMFVCRKRDGSVHIMRGNMNDDNFRRSGSFKVSTAAHACSFGVESCWTTLRNVM